MYHKTYHVIHSQESLESWHVELHMQANARKTIDLGIVPPQNSNTNPIGTMKIATTPGYALLQRDHILGMGTFNYPPVICYIAIEHGHRNS